MPIDSRISERVFTKINMHDGDEKVCWEWLGALGGKEPRRPIIRIDNKVYYASRVVYELMKGEDPGKRVVRHTCDNHLCCNPKHLVIGTQAQNVEDMAMRQRANIYPYKDVQMCRAYLAAGWGPTAIAELLHKKISWVHDISYKRRHQHLPEPTLDENFNIIDWKFDLETGFINEEPVSKSKLMKYGEPDENRAEEE